MLLKSTIEPKDNNQANFNKSYCRGKQKEVLIYPLTPDQ